MDLLVKDLIKEGMAVSEIMNMPYYYILEILNDKHHNRVLSEEQQEAVLNAL